MQESVLLINLIFGICIILAVLFWIMNSRSARKIKLDYQIMFIVGISWLTLGILFSESFVIVIGIVFSFFGLVKRKEWEKDFGKMTHLTRKELIVLVSILVSAVFLLLIIIYKIVSPNFIG